MEFKWKRQFILLAAAGLLLFFAASGGILHLLYGSYREQVILAGNMISEEALLDKGTELLKGRYEPGYEAAREKLRTYGYGRPTQNIFGRSLIRKSILTMGLLFGLYLLWLLVCWLGMRASGKRHQGEMEHICQVLRQFQEGRFEADVWENLKGGKRSEVYMQLESMQGHLKVLTEQAMLEREETKSLVTDISHQLKTPVAALKACFEILLKEKLSGDERAEFSKRCEEQLVGLTQLVAALVDISRMETGMIAVQKEKGRIFDTLLEAVNRVYLKAEEKQITMELEAEEDLQKLEIVHDRKWLCEGFINLLENAVKYSPRGSGITIRMMERTSFLRIEIQDEGIGVPKEEQHQIFKRFYRGNSEAVVQECGSGVGLYLTREIVGQHGGTVMVLSGTGLQRKGSVFVLQLPYL